MEQEEPIMLETQSKEEKHSKLEELQSILESLEEKRIGAKGETRDEQLEYYRRCETDLAPLKAILEDFSDEEKTAYNDDIKKAQEVLACYEELSTFIDGADDGVHYQKLIRMLDRVLKTCYKFEDFNNILDLVHGKEAFLEELETTLEVEYKDLEGGFKKWSEGEEIEDEKLAVIFSKKSAFFVEFVKVYPKLGLSTTYVKEEELKSWGEELGRMKLVIKGVEERIATSLELRDKLKSLLILVERIPSDYSGPLLISKIIEEVTAWNKKKLSETELPEFLKLVEEIKSFKLQNEKQEEDFTWDKLLKKLESYEWRQKVRHCYKTVQEKEAQRYLIEAPTEVKVSKCWEWNQLVERVKEVEWMDDKKIEKKISEYLDMEIKDMDKDEIAKFLNDAKICAISDKSYKKINVLEKSIEIMDDPSADDIEKIIEMMIEAEFWNTKTFERIDNVNRALKNVARIAKEIDELEKSEDGEMQEEGKVEVEKIIGQKRLNKAEVEKTVEKFKTLSHELTKDNALEFEKIQKAIERHNQVKEDYGSKIEDLEKELFKSVEQSRYEELSETFEGMLKAYSGSIIKDLSLEQNLVDLNTLFEGNRIVLDNSKRESLKYWDKVHNNLIKKSDSGKFEDLKLLDLIQEKLTEAKDFLKIVHQVKHSTDSENALTLEELGKLVDEKRSEDMVIIMDESLIYLDTIIARIHHYKDLLDQEKIKLQDVKDGIEFMTSVSINLEELVQKFNNRKERAESFTSKIMLERTKVIEKEFEKFAEEYNGLGIVIPNIEKQFTEMQECRNHNGEADRILAEASAQVEIKSLFELREKMKKMKYFRSSNKLAKLSGKFFYCLREYYENSSSLEQSEAEGSEKEDRFTISFYKIRKLVKEVEHIGSKCKDSVKADLKQKTGFISQIIKDVSEHLSKTVYTMSIDEFRTKEPEKMYRGVINIEESVLEFKKKLEEKEKENKKAKESKKSVHEKPTLSEKITGQARSFYIKNWTDSISKNRTFGKKGKDAKAIAKNLEKSVFTRNSEKPGSYEKSCDEISRILKDICSYIYLSKDIKQKKFSLGAFRILFGKTAADIRRLNYMKKNDQQNKDRPLQSLAMKAKDVESEKMKEKGQKKLRSDPYKPEYAMAEEISVDQTITTVEDSVAQGEYKYYRIYSGEVKVQDESNINLNLDEAQMLTCTKYSVLTSFGKIPNSLSITTRIKKDGFEKYINRVMDSKNSKNYKIVVGWFDLPFGMNNIKNLLVERNCVASRQYSNSCKIFVFPKEYILSNWIRKMDFSVVGKAHDIMFMLVLKESMSDNAKIVPETMSIAGKKAYKLRYHEGMVRQRPINVESLRENLNFIGKKENEKMLKKRKKPKSGTGMRDFKPRMKMKPFKNRSNIDLIKNAQAGVEKILQKYNNVESSVQQPQQKSYPKAYVTNFAKNNFKNQITSRDLLKPENPQTFINYRNEFVNVRGYNPPMSRQERFFRSRENSIEMDLDQNYKKDLLGTLQSTNKPRPQFYQKKNKHKKKMAKSRRGENQKYFNRSSNIFYKKHPTAAEPVMKPKPKTHSQEKKQSYLQNAINSIQVSNAGYNPGRLASLVREPKNPERQSSLASLTNPYGKAPYSREKVSFPSRRSNNNPAILFNGNNEVNYRNSRKGNGYFFN